MIYFLLIAFLNFSNTSNDIPVLEYQVEYNLGKSLFKKGYVFNVGNKTYFTTTESVFLEDLPKLATNKEGVPTINVSLGGNSHENIIQDRGEGILRDLRSIGSKMFVTKEDLILNSWRPTGKNKEVSGRECIEMTTEFRGRTYMAYVDLSVPINYGPWKFNNFPGLPVMIEETEGKLKWTLTQIFNEEKSKINDDIKNLENHFESLPEKPLKEYVEMYDRTRGGTSVIFARMPRDFKEDKLKGNNGFKRGGLELKYEWEN